MWKGVGPAPAPTSRTPTSEEAGQLGEAISSAPSLGLSRAWAAAILASEHCPMPASLAVSPGGKVVSSRAIRWEPSSRLSFTTSGLKAPALGLSVPAVKAGLLGACSALVGQGPPPGKALGVKESLGLALGVCGALQGMSSVVVVALEQVGGVCSGALAPLKRWTLASSSGSSGFSSKRVVS